MITIALTKAKELIDFYLSDDISELEPQQIESIRHIILSLNCGCGCDDYNGFSCGCGNRSVIVGEALKELEALKQEGTK